MSSFKGLGLLLAVAVLFTRGSGGFEIGIQHVNDKRFVGRLSLCPQPGQSRVRSHLLGDHAHQVSETIPIRFRPLRTKPAIATATLVIEHDFEALADIGITIPAPSDFRVRGRVISLFLFGFRAQGHLLHHRFGVWSGALAQLDILVCFFFFVALDPDRSFVTSGRGP